MKDNLRWIGFILVVSLMGCGGSKSLSTSNLSDIYRYNSATMHPELVVFHESEASTRVYFKIPTSELLYARRSSEIFTAQLTLHYELLDSYEETTVLDSTTLLLTDTGSANPERAILGSFLVKTTEGKHHVLQVTVRDLLRRKETRLYAHVDRRDRRGRQYFLLRDGNKGVPLFDNHLTKRQKVRIEAADPNLQTLFGRYYLREFPLAPPPFSVTNPRPFDYEADSLFAVQRSTEVEYFEFEMPKRGLFHLCPDSTSRKGFTLTHFSNNFPAVKSPKTLQEPLRFITSKKEFKALTESENSKEALDEFWLSNSANKERARELIKNYYSRVNYANLYFTSHTEGWRTDRGMIYLIFGPPNVVYKTSGGESWTYGEENNYMSITYNFATVDNPFTENDFALARSPIYKSNWYRAVDIWRHGRVLGSD
ncbi:MAG: GWxTD domain-containing protein [Salibacteraceae bacterium]